MSLDHIRDLLHEARARFEADAGKDAQSVLPKLAEVYAQLTSADRALADEVLADWVRSPDEGLRFDARYLIHTYRIMSAVPALREQHALLAAVHTPGAPFERMALARLLAHLGAPLPTRRP